jgi:DNA-binding transcriptional LysR family regulator
MCRDRWLGVELRHLAALEAIASEGSFRGAADHLGYVQSSVSQQIAVLEGFVGARLVERSRGTKPLSLTVAGDLLLHHAADVLARMRAARADIDGLRAGRSGRVRVGTFPGVAGRVIPRVLTAFARRWPDVELQISEWPTDAPLFEQVAAGTLDVGFAHLPLESGPFASCELLRSPTALMVAADSPLARREVPPSPEEIARLPLIGRQTSHRLPRLGRRPRAARRSPGVVFRSDLNETTRALVAAGLGVALVSRFAVAADDERIALVDLGDRVPPVTVGLFWHRERLLAPAAQDFGELARAACAEIAAEDDQCALDAAA